MSKNVTQLTIRGFDRDLENAIKGLAGREGISLNRAALRLMRQGAGIGPDAQFSDRIGDRLDHLMGTWSEEEEREFIEAVEEFERIDEDLWR